MQETSTVFDQILATGRYESEVRIFIAGEIFQEDRIVDVSVNRTVFNANELKIGSTCIGSCEITLAADGMTGRELSDTIPKCADVQILERIMTSDRSQVSEWLSQGVFFVDQRDYTSWAGRLSLSCLDRMAMADTDFPITSGWPKSDIDVVGLIANQMEVALDPDVYTIMNANYEIPDPTTTYTMREVLGFIAVMYCGNWVIDSNGNLTLLTLDSLPTETNLLVTESGDAIKFGSDRILV